MSFPSSPVEISTRNVSPTPAPEGRVATATSPFGWRAPAARQVKVASSRRLVSSISILRDIVTRPYRFGPLGTEPNRRVVDSDGRRHLV